MPRGEYYLADAGYKDKNVSSCVSRQMLNDVEKRRFDGLMARHETVNRRFKEWGILQQTYRHSEICHGSTGVFNAIAVITQLDMEDGRPVWSY